MDVRRSLMPLLVAGCLLIASCGSSATPAGTGNATNPTAASGGQAAAPAAGATAEGNAAASANPNATEFRVAWWGSKDRHDRTIKVLDLFQKDNPNIKITYEFSAFDDYFTKLTTQAAGNNLPCLIQQDYQKISDWVARDLLLPLDDYVAKGTINTKNVDKVYLDSGKLNDKLYAISMGTNTQSLIFDTAAFQKAGVALPKEDWTWDEFEQSMAQIKEKAGVYGMSTGLDDSQVFKLWLKQHGKWLYSPDGTALGYDDDKLFVDFFTMIKRMMDKGSMPDRAFEVSLGTSGSVEDNILVKQQAASAYQWSNQVVALIAATNGRALESGLLPRPQGAPTSGLYLKPSQFLSITKGCNQPDVAAKLIDYFTNSVPANEILLAERGVPISSEVRSAIEPKLSTGQKEAFKVVSLVEKNPSPLDPPDPAGSVEVVTKTYVGVMDQVLYGQMSPEDGAKQFREQASAILAKNKK